MKKNKVINITTIVLAMVVVISCAPRQETRVPQNIIILIGDGMGFSQVAATEYEQGPLNMTGMPFAGALFTHSANSRVTDSAAGATALATGFKTNNGKLAVLPDGTPVQTIAQYASEIGKQTAILANSSITHATPAGFGVNHTSRGDQFIIAEKFVESGISMLLGSGYNYFLPKAEGGGRPDDRNLINELRSKDYYYIDNESDLADGIDYDKVAVFLAGNHLESYPERGDQMVRLTKFALGQLSRSDKGFFMMIEGSMIDWESHANDPWSTIQETLDFDNVIGEVLDFAKKDGNTLVIVTADHETGGLTLLRGDGSDGITYEWATGGHSASLVPIFSYGPSAELFAGVYDNIEVARKMFSLWGKDITDQ